MHDLNDGGAQMVHISEVVQVIHFLESQKKVFHAFHPLAEESSD